MDSLCDKTPMEFMPRTFNSPDLNCLPDGKLTEKLSIGINQVRKYIFTKICFIFMEF